MECLEILLWLDICRISLDHVLTKNINGDKYTVLTKVNQEVLVLNFVSEDLQRDSDIVMSAVNQSGKDLKFSLEELKKESDLVMDSVKYNR